MKKSDGAAYFRMFIWFIVGLLCLNVRRLWLLTHHLMMIHFPDPFLVNYLPNGTGFSRQPVPETCDHVVFESVREVHGLHDFKSALKIIEADVERPIMFRKFLKHPVEDWKQLELQYTNETVSFNTGEQFHRGGLWASGAQSTGKMDMKIGEFFNQKQINSSIQYCSFVRFLDPKFVQDVEGHSLNEFINVGFDTNFLSNFNEDLLATPIHAAPLVKSYSLQYVGKKLWVFFRPEEMELFDPINIPSTNVMTGNEVEYMKNRNHLLVVVQEEGDFFYFPPHWGHAVFTKKGPNVMINFRELDPMLSLKINFWRGLEGLLVRWTTSSKIKLFNPLNGLQVLKRLETFPKFGKESPCASRFSQLVA